MKEIKNNAAQVYLPIMGGLGNQLFQVHAAASISEGAVIHLDEELFGKVTMNSNLEFEKKYRILISLTSCGSLPYRWITRRLSGLILRINPLAENWKVARIAGKILRVLATMAFSIRYKKSIRLIAPYTVGFHSLECSLEKPIVLLGYFQSYKYINEVKLVRNQKNEIFFDNQTSEFYNCFNSQIEKPLIVHVRLGDYSKNPKIGLLDSHYYTANLMSAYDESNCSSLWLFSNDIPNAVKYIPHELIDKLRVKEDKDLSDSQILDFMSQGHAFFLANSTFSWWAARLSSAAPEKIYVPSPWYSSLHDPIELIPPDWQSIPSIFAAPKS